MTLDGLRGAAIYNPGLWSDEELRQYFVARTDMLQRILNDIAAESTGASRRHRLILGLRGMGKTTLLRRIALGVAENPTLNSEWLPLTFPEEQYNVARLGDLWLNCLDSLSDALEISGQLKAAEELDRNIEAVQGNAGEAYKLLIDTSKRLQRRLILLVDSIDLIFDRLKDEQWEFREILQSEPQILFIGASARAIEATFQYDAAFYDFFKIDELQRLSIDETRSILARLATIENSPKVLSLLESDRARIQTLHTLTGGNPRTIVLLFKVLTRGLDGDVRSDLEGLLDVVTPLYKARFEELPQLSQQIVDALALHWDPATANALSEIMGMDINKVSAQLSRLETNAIIEKVKPASGKRSAFQISERFFNIWYLMRASRRVRRKLVWLVHFLRMFFSADELRVHARRYFFIPDANAARNAEYAIVLAHAIEAKAMRAALENHALQALLKDEKSSGSLDILFDLSGTDAKLLPKVERMKSLQALRQRLFEALSGRTHDVELFCHHFIGSPSSTLEEKWRFAESLPIIDDVAIQKRLRQLTVEWERYNKSHGELTEHLYCALGSGEMESDSDFVGAESVAERLDCPLLAALPWAFRITEGPPLTTEECQRADHAFREALLLDPHCAWARNSLGRLQHEYLEDPLEAEENYRSAIKINPHYATPWTNLGRLFVKMGKYKEAEENYWQAVQSDALNSFAWMSLAALFEKVLQRPEKAEEIYKQAIIANPENKQLHWKLAGIFSGSNRTEEALALYKKLIDLDPSDVRTWMALGYFLHSNDRYGIEAADAYRRALALNPTSSSTWNDYGWLLIFKLKQYDEGETALRKAIELDENNLFAWRNLAQLYGLILDRRADAELSYQRAIEIDEKKGPSWLQYADFLSLKDSFAEAEVAYRKAIELSDNPSQAWTHLGIDLAYKLKRPIEAESAFRNAVAANPEFTQAWLALAHLVGYVLHRESEAEQIFRESIQAQPNDAERWGGLGCIISIQVERSIEAEAALKKAIELSPNESSYLLELGSLLLRSPNRMVEARDACRAALRLKPTNDEAWVVLGIVLAERFHQHEEAAEAFRSAIKLSPTDSYLWNNLGFVLSNLLHDYDAGEAAYRKAIELNKENPFALNNLGDLLTHYRGRKDEAEAVYHQASQLGTDNLGALATIARSHIATGNWKYAERHIHQLITAGGNYGLENVWLDIVVMFKEAIAAGNAEDALKIVDSTVAHERWRPLREAIAAVIIGTDEYLNGVAPEVREPALKITSQLRGGAQ